MVAKPDLRFDSRRRSPSEKLMKSGVSSKLRTFDRSVMSILRRLIACRYDVHLHGGGALDDLSGPLLVLSNHPGPRRWQANSHSVVDYAGAVTCRRGATRSVALHYRATPTRGLRAEVWGPVDLRIEARPLHPPDANHRLDGLRDR